MSRAYVYDAKRDRWAGVHTALNIVAPPRVLSGGDESKNYNIMPYNATDIYRYPGDLNTTEEHYIITKAYDIVRATFVRWKLLFSSGTVDVTTHVELDDTEYTDDKSSITSDKWYGITNGKNLGKHIYFKITGATNIYSSLFEYIRRGVR